MEDYADEPLGTSPLAHLLNIAHNIIMVQTKYGLVAAMVVTAMTFIVGGDVAGRLLSQDGFAPTFVAWTRFALAAVVLLPFCGLQKGEARMLLRPQLIFRGALIALGIACILTALQTEQMADVFGAFFVGPIVSYFLAAALLGERITPVRTALLLISFGGVMLVVKPGFGMTMGLGFAVLAGCFHGSYLVATRWLAPDYRPRFLLLSQLIAGSVLLLPFAFAELPDMTTRHMVLIGLSAGGSALGNLLLVLANRRAPASVIAPFIYSQLIAATVFGFWVFGDLPDTLAFAGLGIIMLAGIASVIAARQVR